MQGDVTDIYGADGVHYASYKYDAWGNHSPVPYIDKDGIGTLNPFRYRGYYYDTETGLYYVKSRYYDPVVGRFVNADVLLDQRSILGYNLFAYCLNNPVNLKDDSGQLAAGAATAGYIIGSNFWNPIGLAAIIVLAAVCISVAFVNSKTQSTTKIKTLPDVKPKRQLSGHYYLAYLSNYGEIIKVGYKMEFVSALAALGVSGATNSLAVQYTYNRGNSSDAQRELEHRSDTGQWGIYADSQEAAKALAVVFGYFGKPEVHSSGMYGHYHDSTHTFHIWYGGKITY